MLPIFLTFVLSSGKRVGDDEEQAADTRRCKDWGWYRCII